MGKRKQYNLAVLLPKQVPEILETTAAHYRQRHAKTSADWQDYHAGRVWMDLATILDRAAASCKQALKARK